MQATNSQDSVKVGSQEDGARLQFSTFYIANRLYGIDVTRVQEIVRPLAMTSIPLAQRYVRGLINLRGQVATAIGLRELFDISESPPDAFMNVVCKIDGTLVSMQVDEIGDVIEVSRKEYEATPQTVDETIRRFMSGVYKISGSLLSVIDIDRIYKFLNNKLA